MDKIITEDIKTNGVKAVIIGDIHFQYQKLLEADQFTQRCFDHLNSLIDKGIELDFIVVLGDVFHTHETTKTPVVKKVSDFLIKLCEYAYTYVLIGNHDYINKYQYLSDNHAFYPMKHWDLPITIVDKPMIHTIKGKDFVFVPYVPDGRFAEALSELAKENSLWEMADCIFSHNLFDGLKMGPKLVEGVESWSTDNPPIINGHIHDMQAGINGDNTINGVFCTGSSTSTSVSDRDSKNIWYTVFDNESDESDYPYFKTKLLPMDIKNRVVKDYTMNSIINFNLSDYPSEKYEVKINLHGTNQEFRLFRKKDLYKQLLKNNVKLSYYPTDNKSGSETKDKVLNNVCMERYNFSNILDELVQSNKSANSGYTKQVYNEIKS